MNLKNTYFKVLDDGFIALKDYMGSDEDVEQAARVSYGKGTRKVNETRGLLRYLMRHRHSSPIEMVEYKFHVRVPMDTWRQWIRHRTASVNEYSTRYSEAIDSKQKTSEWRLQAQNNKQGSSGLIKDWPDGVEVKSFGDGGYAIDGLDRLIPCSKDTTPESFLSNEELKLHTLADRVYKRRLKFGIAREQARKDLPLSTYTEAYWKIDLKNLLHFLSLRCDSHAQYEIRQYANVIAGIVKETCPLVFEAWYDYQFAASVWTRLDKLLFKEIVSNHAQWPDTNILKLKDNSIFVDTVLNPCVDKIGMSKRELEEFWQKLEIEEQDFTLDFNNLYKRDE